MWRYLFLAWAIGATEAAVIRGTVVENQTGHALARSLVVLESATGAAGPKRSVRTNSYGTFEFQQIAAGAYLVTASRTGFAAVQYGQKQWKSAGIPVIVADSDSPFLNIRLPRFGAITGTVLDENDVGLPDHDVVAYRDRRPPLLVTRARSDDRGVFRLHGLEPGNYLVRSAGKQYEEGGYLPTFAKETQAVDQAHPVEVTLDQQVDRIDIRPMGGRLFTLDVSVITFPPNMGPVTLTLASDIGRETVQAVKHRFGPLPPGQYELFAQAPLDHRSGTQGDYQKIQVGRDTDMTISLHQVPELQVTFAGAPGQAIDSSSIRVLARRKDLAGEGRPELLKLTNNRLQLAPGPWELAIQPSPAFYVSGFSGPRYQRPNDGRADGWNEILAGAGASVQFQLSSTPGAVHGTVKSAAGAPVFLEAIDLELRRRVTEMLVTRTDMRGQYQFTGLAPGNYRVLSSFEYQMPDSETMSTAGAKSVKVDAGGDVRQDLDLYVIR